jgi:hypothetical protein
MKREQALERLATVTRLVDELPVQAWLSLQMNWNQCTLQVDLHNLVVVAGDNPVTCERCETDGKKWLGYATTIDGIEIIAVGETDE